MTSKDYSVESAVDYMVALAQREREQSAKYREAIESEDDYYREKVAAKADNFLRREEEFLRAWAEIKTNWPRLAAALEADKPYLKKRLETAEAAWLEYQNS